jgi:glycosyltransferase involved in cell wall biosynthesis
MDNNASIIIPCFNEENSLETVVTEVKQAMDSYIGEYEIIIIDDCSTDDSVKIAESLDVVLIKNEKNIGAGASRVKGIEKAKYNLLVYIDADCTYTATDIPRLLKHFPESDQVIGYRHAEMGRTPLLRKFVKSMARYLASILVWEYIADLNTGLRAFKKDKFKNHLHLLPSGFSCVTTMTLISYCLGHKVSYISTHYKTRVGYSKFHPVKDTFLLFTMIFKTVLKLKPYKIVLLLFSSLIFIGTLVLNVSSTYTAFIYLITIVFYLLISMYTSKDSMRYE